MQKPSDFDSAQAAGNIEVLPVGAYKCKIMKAEPMTSSNGKEFIKISYDINDGDYKDFYKRKYQNDSRDIKDKKWSGVWTVFVLDYNGNTNRYFKGLITCAESSNKGFKFDFDKPEALKDKLIGVVMREEEFESQTGEILTAVKAFRACPYEATDEQQIPKKKEIKKENNSLAGMVIDNGGDDLPF